MEIKKGNKKHHITFKDQIPIRITANNKSVNKDRTTAAASSSMGDANSRLKEDSSAVNNISINKRRDG
jgi:hypothetical protein